MRLATIGRPGIGGEFLAIHALDHGRYQVCRFKQASHHREEQRQLKVDSLPGDTLVFDLLTAIEAIVEHASIDLDHHGIVLRSVRLAKASALMAEEDWAEEQ